MFDASLRDSADGFRSSIWVLYHAYILYGAMIIAQKFADTFKEFPIIQKPNTFTIDDAVKMMHDTASGGG